MLPGAVKWEGSWSWFVDRKMLTSKQLRKKELAGGQNLDLAINKAGL